MKQSASQSTNRDEVGGDDWNFMMHPVIVYPYDNRKKAEPALDSYNSKIIQVTANSSSSNLTGKML